MGEGEGKKEGTTEKGRKVTKDKRTPDTEATPRGLRSLNRMTISECKSGERIRVRKRIVLFQ